MHNTIAYRLPIALCEGGRHLLAVVERLVVDECIKLGLPVVVLDLGEHQLDGLEVVPVGHVVYGLHLPPLHSLLDDRRLMDHEVVHEDVGLDGSILAMQLRKELDERIFGDCLVEDHDGIDTTVA